MDVILSIKPKYANYIYEGIKYFELRRVIPKNLKIGDTIYLYESAPVKKITGYFINGPRWCISSSSEGLYKSIGEKCCVAREEFFKYFNGAKKCWGLHVTKPFKFKNAIVPNWKTAPQNFIYAKYPIKEG